MLGVESDFCVLSGVNLMKRLERYYDSYKRALNLKNSTGVSVTTEELQVGFTMESKVKKICPHFQRMDDLFGERPNVLPHEFSTGLQNGNGEIMSSTHTVPGPAVPFLASQSQAPATHPPALESEAILALAPQSQVDSSPFSLLIYTCL
ncbi:unnamed protein product [Calypogeia fissa]